MAIPKILGTETEYGIIRRHDPEFDPIARTLTLISNYQPEALIPSLWECAQKSSKIDPHTMSLDDIYDIPDSSDPLSIIKVLTNEGRFYLDHIHPEYAMPECANIHDLLRYEKAGDHILDQSRHTAEQTLTSGQQILPCRSNSDHKGNSYGDRENYLLDRCTPFRLIAEQFAPFLVSRQIFCGLGKVGVETDREIDLAVDNPPVDTRACFLRSLPEKFRQQVYYVTWDSLAFSPDEGEIRRIALEDPFEGIKSQIIRALETATCAAEFVAALPGI